MKRLLELKKLTRSKSRTPSLGTRKIPSGSISQLANVPFDLSRSPVPQAISRASLRDPRMFLAIGIDFGTTFSGVSWAFSGEPDSVEPVGCWPGPDGRIINEKQVPTQIDLATNTWGYMVPQDARSIKWFKLLLLEKSDLRGEVTDSDILRDAREQLQKRNIRPIQLVSKFLKRVWQHALSEIKHQMGAENVDDLPFKVAITVPAIWPQYARDAMKKAAKMSGILDSRDIGETFLMLVEEPEAAAVATLLHRKKFPEVKTNEVFVVCDCGGGTVDMSSYKITSMNPFQIEENVRGEGKLCGAFRVDDEFQKFMKLKSGLAFKNHDDVVFRRFVQGEWESSVKRDFNGQEETDYIIRPPLSALSYETRVKGAQEADEFRLSRSRIKQFFARSLDGIKELLARQVAGVEKNEGKKPKRILLVGGLGSSRYIFNQLNEIYGNISQPENGWSAVARGATVKLLRHSFATETQSNTPLQQKYIDATPSVTSRISKLSYGIQTASPISSLDPPYDPEKDQVYRNPVGLQVASRMQWYLLRGERVDNKNPISFGFVAYIPDGDRMLRAPTWDVYTSEAEPPPIRQDPETVECMGRIDSEYDIPFEDLPQINEDGWRKIDNLTIAMSFEGEPQWTLRIGDRSTEQPVGVTYME